MVSLTRQNEFIPPCHLRRERCIQHNQLLIITLLVMRYKTVLWDIQGRDYVSLSPIGGYGVNVGEV